MIRPNEFDLCLIENDIVYASNTVLNNQWVGGLFAKVDINEREVLCDYTGIILSPTEAKLSSSEYLFSVRDPKDMRRRKVVDGDPQKSSNIAAYANYSEHMYANAIFIDQTTKNATCKIVLVSKEFIPAGCEIRVDYDMGSSTHPFRDSMILKGIFDRNTSYKETIWNYPGRCQC
tara:strand:- start:2139 stop:2663 length:525 start_codon:yes stop_codon:yes gene_type:complete